VPSQDLAKINMSKMCLLKIMM